MVSIGPGTQSYNFSHMWDLGDLRGYPPRATGCPNTLMAIVTRNPDFSKFKFMMNLGRMEGILDGAQADFTLFVPSDRALQGLNPALFSNMDSAVARHIVKSSMLDHRITSELLADSPSAFFYTKDPPNRLFVSNISGITYINNDINIIQADIPASNGIIHVVDKLIWPEML